VVCLSMLACCNSCWCNARRSARSLVCTVYCLAPVPGSAPVQGLHFSDHRREDPGRGAVNWLPCTACYATVGGGGCRFDNLLTSKCHADLCTTAVLISPKRQAHLQPHCVFAKHANSVVQSVTRSMQRSVSQLDWAAGSPRVARQPWRRAQRSSRRTAMMCNGQHVRHTFLGLLAKIKCSICSYQFNR
jgi:hypothetical protein